MREDGPMPQVAFAPDVYTTTEDGHRLVGGRCRDCDSVTFPRPVSCARCGSTEVDEHLLPRRGELWTFTTQGFLPKEPYAGGETDESFRPFGVGLVQLGDEVRVEARLTESDPEHLRIGMDMELTIVPFRVDPDGTEVMTFAFAPVPSSTGRGV
jgi:uncharacterized OB-fold protein